METTFWNQIQISHYRCKKGNRTKEMTLPLWAKNDDEIVTLDVSTSLLLKMGSPPPTHDENDDSSDDENDRKSFVIYYFN